MSTESESFLARWSRRKRAAERDAIQSAEPVEAGPQRSEAGAEGPAVTGPPPAPASVVTQAGRASTEIELPPIDSLDGLRSDYEAFFKQPVEEQVRHAALQKLFADPHFNKMDMLDVYVDDYTNFEPLPAELRLRLPSARGLLLDSERAALESDAGAGEVAEVGEHVEAASALRSASSPTVDAGREGLLPQSTSMPSDPSDASGSDPSSPSS